MDQQLRRAVRQATDDPIAFGKAATALERAGDLVGAARLIRGACERAGATVDVLTPPSIEALEPSVESHRARLHLDGVAWWPDERGLWVNDATEDNDPDHLLTFEIMAWPLGGAATCLLAPKDVPPPPGGGTPPYSKRPYTKAEHCLRQVTSLAATTDGTLAFTGLSVACEEAGEAWYVFNPTTRKFTHGPVIPPRDGIPPALRVVAGWGNTLVGRAGPALFVWNLATDAAPDEWLTNGEVSEGTVVVLEKKELLFHRLGEAEPFARQPYPIAVPKGWTGLVAASSGRCVVCDQETRELILIDSVAGELARASIPAGETSKKAKAGAPAKIVAVRPCPSGRVVAVRFERSSEIALVDLRRGAGRLIELEHTPHELVWSPSGRALALPSQGGVLQLLTAGGS